MLEGFSVKNLAIVTTISAHDAHPHSELCVWASMKFLSQEMNGLAPMSMTQVTSHHRKTYKEQPCGVVSASHPP